MIWVEKDVVVINRLTQKNTSAYPLLFSREVAYIQNCLSYDLKADILDRNVRSSLLKRKTPAGFFGVVNFRR